jgi:hypothetical protein
MGRPREQSASDVLDRRLADRPGDADDAGAKRAPPTPGKSLQPGQRVGRSEDPGALEASRVLGGDDDAP